MVYHNKPYLRARLLHSNTSRVMVYPTMKTPGLYDFPFKSYKNSAQAPFFQKWILVYKCESFFRETARFSSFHLGIKNIHSSYPLYD
jgi:hypothetical protein